MWYQEVWGNFLHSYQSRKRIGSFFQSDTSFEKPGRTATRDSHMTDQRPRKENLGDRWNIYEEFHVEAPKVLSGTWASQLARWLRGRRCCWTITESETNGSSTECPRNDRSNFTKCEKRGWQFFFVRSRASIDRSVPRLIKPYDLTIVEQCQSSHERREVILSHPSASQVNAPRHRHKRTLSPSLTKLCASIQKLSMCSAYSCASAHVQKGDWVTEVDPSQARQRTCGSSFTPRPDSFFFLFLPSHQGSFLSLQTLRTLEQLLRPRRFAKLYVHSFYSVPKNRKFQREILEIRSHPKSRGLHVSAFFIFLHFSLGHNRR